MTRGRRPSAEHIAIVAELRDEWRQLALSTVPADRAAAERAANVLYRRAGIPQPPVMWFDSPPQAAVALAFLTSGANRRNQARQHLGSKTVDHLVALGERAATAGRLEGRVLRPRLGGAATTRRVRQWLTNSLAEWSSELRRIDMELARSLRLIAQRQLSCYLAARVQHWVFRGVSSVRAADVAVRLDFDTRARSVPGRQAHPQVELARNAGWSWIYEDLLVLSDRPEVLRLDERGVPHAAGGPALAWRDGWQAWAWHGVLVPREVIEAPETITVESIHAEPDVEVRRVALERFGVERYLYAADVTTVHRDGYGVLYSAPVPGDEPIVMVEVTNMTPEPDGTYKRYLLRVPPTMRTAHEAVAWSFGESPETYQPRTQT
jgi:hypothetical protein